MTTRAAIVAEARSWIGTKFHHQGRMKGVGVDCAGLVIATGWNVGVPFHDVTGYGPQPHARMIEEEARKQLDRINLELAQPGDVILFKVERDPQHLAVITQIEPEVYFVHAFSKLGKVVENRLDAFWRMRITAVYRFPSVEGE